MKHGSPVLKTTEAGLQCWASQSDWFVSICGTDAPELEVPQLKLAATEPSRWEVRAAFGARTPFAFEKLLRGGSALTGDRRIERAFGVFAQAARLALKWRGNKSAG
jgi:hypothetical protein